MLKPHESCTREIHKPLDTFQHETVHLTTGKILVAAAAGSGKSTTNILRVEQLICDGIDPSRIGVFTFARDAANDLQKRLKQLNIENVQASTLHALSYSIIKEDGAHVGGNFTIDDKQLILYGAQELISRNYKQIGLDAKKAQALFAMAKANCLSMHHLALDTEACEELFKPYLDKPWLVKQYVKLFKDLEEWKINKKLIDFDDLLYLSWHLLVTHDDIQHKWNSKFDYLLIDEAQDSSSIQNAITSILSKRSGNVTLTGDIQQALYEWRSAKPQEFVAFSRNSSVYRLPTNYRSTQEICKAATNLTAGLAWNITGETVPHAVAPSDPDSIAAVEYESPEHEAESIACEIQELVTARGYKYGDVAILYRIVALLQPLESALLARNIPYVVWSGHTFYDRKEVKDVLSYLYVAAMRDPTNMWVKRAVNAPFRYISKQYLQCVDEVAINNGITYIDALQAYKGPRENQNTSMRRFVKLLFALNNMYANNRSPTELIQYMLSETRYLHTLKQEEGEEGPDPDSGKSTHVHQLLKIAEGFKTVGAYLDYVNKMEQLLRESRHKRSSDAVVLSTVHKSKGLAWPAVYGVGWNEGILPHAKAQSVDEELRVAYVCMTRAAKRFRASWTQTQVTQGGNAQLPMSRFIERSKMPVQRLKIKERQPIDIVRFLQANPDLMKEF